MDLLKMFDYQTWADEKVFHFLEELSEKEIMKTFEGYTSIKQRMDHIVMALEVWYDRINGHSPSKLPSYIDETSDVIIQKWRELNTKLSVYFSTRRISTFTYKNSTGRKFQNEHEDVAVHIMNHTTFYRSQIIMMIRMLGYPVENTDYIYYLRSA